MTTRTLIVPTTHHFAAQSDHARDFGDLQRAKARIAELEAEVARLKVDAERYRWLRNSAGDSTVGVYKNGVRGRQWIDGAEMDLEINAALAASKGA